MQVNRNRSGPGSDSRQMSTDPRVAAVIYAAKSTEDRHGSIGTQLDDCRAAATSEDRAVVAEYHDEAASAFHGDRGPGLKAALEHAEQLASEHDHAELWVQHPDRLARGDGLQATHLAEYVFSCRRAGVQLRAVQHDDTFHDLIRAMLTGERNHEDSARKAAATAAGLRRAAERGDWVGGICPDGYRVLRDVDDRGTVTRRLELDPARAEIYRVHFALALAGQSDRAIVLALDERGYLTRPQKAAHRPRPFDANRVRQTLTNPFYAGLAVYRGEVVGPGRWPALVTPADFDRIRRRRAARGHGGKPGPRTGRPPEGYVLARVGACGVCGAPMDVVTVRYVRKDGSRKRTYVCRAHRERPQDCAAAPLDATLVDRAFVANLTSFLGDVEGWRGQLVATRDVERQRMATEVDRAQDALATCERVIAGARARYGAALATGADERAAGIEEFIEGQRVERTRAERRLAAALAAMDDASVPGESLDPLLDFYNGLSAELAGRVRGARGDVKRLNVAVQEFFDRVELTQQADGVRILPILGADASARILAGLDHWPHDLRASLAGVDATLVAGGEVDGDQPLTLEVPADAAGELRRRLEAGEALEALIDIAGPPSVLATGQESIAPPLRAITASVGNPPPRWWTRVSDRSLALPAFLAAAGQITTPSRAQEVTP
jgi:DNA invertase Pin-like site-specific DNA recombinase